MLNKFQSRSSTYKCRSCGHNTRNVEGDEAEVRLCLACYTLAGEDNCLSDTGEFYSLHSVKQMIERLDRQCGAGTAKRLFPEVVEQVEEQ